MAKSGSESSISEACDTVKEETKTDETLPAETSDPENNTARKEALEVPIANMSKRGSLTSAKSLHELKHESQKLHRDNGADGNKADEDVGNTKGIRPSKSDTSLTESFVVIDNEYNKRKYQNVLRDGNFVILIGFSNVCITNVYFKDLSGNVN